MTSRLVSALSLILQLLFLTLCTNALSEHNAKIPAELQSELAVGGLRVKRLVQGIDGVKFKQDELRTKQTEFQARLTELETEQNSFQVQLHEKSSILAQVQSQQTVLQTRLNEKFSHMSKLQATHAQLVVQLNDKLNDISKLTSAKNLLESRLADLSAEFIKVQADHQSFQIQLNKNSGQLSLLQGERGRIEATVRREVDTIGRIQIDQERLKDLVQERERQISLIKEQQNVITAQIDKKFNEHWPLVWGQQLHLKTLMEGQKVDKALETVQKKQSDLDAKINEQEGILDELKTLKIQMEEIVQENWRQLKSFRNDANNFSHLLKDRESHVTQIQGDLNTLNFQLKKKSEPIARLETDQIWLEDTFQDLIQSQVPPGFVYVQLGGQEEPKTIWPDLVWRDITRQYSGLFFRAEGLDSAPFGVVQEQSSPRITDGRYNRVYSKSGLVENATFPCGGWSSSLILGNPINFPHSEKWPPAYPLVGSRGYQNTIQFKTSDCQVLPRNQAVRIWERVVGH